MIEMLYSLSSSAIVERDTGTTETTAYDYTFILLLVRRYNIGFCDQHVTHKRLRLNSNSTGTVL
jgi:hypothetical protein